MSCLQQVALICATLVSCGMATGSAGGYCAADTSCTGANTNGVCQDNSQCGCATDTDCADSTSAWGRKYCAASKCVSCKTNGDCSFATCDTTTNTCKADAGCKCDTKCEDDYKAKFWGFSIGGVVIAIAFIVVSSVPCCCGKDFGSPMCPKIAGCTSIIFGLLAMLFPAFGVGAATDGAVNDTCDSCNGGCTDKQREDMKAILNTLGIFVAYIAGGGWLCIILGIVSACIGCCACCPCCGPLANKKNAVVAAAGPPAVAVGQPVDQPLNK